MDPAVALWYNEGVVVWTRPTGELWYSEWNGFTGGGTWSPATPLVASWPSLMVSWVKRPEIAYVANHDAIAVWTDGVQGSGLSHVYYSVFDGTTWTYPADLDPYQPNGVAVETRKGISSDRFGNAIVVWNDEMPGGNWDNQYSIWIGQGFSTAQAIYPGIYPGSKGAGTAVAFDQTDVATAIHGTDLPYNLLTNDIWSNRESGFFWYPPVPVTLAPPLWYHGFEPRIAHLTNGNAVAVFTGMGQALPDADIIYRLWEPASGWTSGGPIHFMGLGLLGDDGPWFWGPVSIAAASGSPTSPLRMSGHYVDAIAVWSHDAGGSNLYDIYYSIYDATANTWWSLGGNPTDVIASLSGDDFFPAISFDQMGNAIAVWSHDTGPGFDIYYSQWLGGGWTAPAAVASLADDDMDPAVALYHNAGVAVWVHSGVGGAPSMYYSLWNGIFWGTATWLNSPNAWPQNLDFIRKQPEVAYDARNNTIAVWTDRQNTSPFNRGHVWYSKFNGVIWSSPAEIPGQSLLDGAAVETRKGISSDRLGNAIVVWNAEDFEWDNQYSIWSGTFSAAAPIYPNNGIGPSRGRGIAVAFDQNNDATSIHGVNRIGDIPIYTPEIWSNRKVGSTWHTPVLVTYFGLEPRVVHLSNGDAVAVWQYLDPVILDNDIIYRLWEPGSGWTMGGLVDPAGLPGDDGPWRGPVSIAAASGSPTSPVFIHDVAVTSVVPQRTVIAQGFSVKINVTIQNQGDVTEPVNVTVYANTTIVETKTNITLTSGNSTTLTFTWNTTGFAKGNYTISAYAWPVSGEIDTEDNSLTDGWILITKVGDLGGGVPPQFFKCDDKVDGKDLALFLQCYKNTSPPEAMYLADLGGGVPPRFYQCDGKVDGKDLALFLQCYKGLGP
jgi:hypothetical protein